jgi:hypothetical protein
MEYMVVLNSVKTATHSRGPLCVGRQQRALLEWQDIIYPDDQNGQCLRRHRGARGGGGRHGGGNCGGGNVEGELSLGRIIFAP